MKKIILFCFFCIFFSGCSAEYYLTIDDQERHIYDENGIISSFDFESISSIYQNEWPTNAYVTDEYFSESPVKIPGVEYYNVQSYSDFQYHVKYSYSFPSDKFSNAYGVLTAFPEFSKEYNPNNNVTTLDTGAFSFHKFSNLEKLAIHITVHNKVVNHNATSVSGNVYTWVLDSTNFDSSRLVLSYEGGGTPFVEKKEDVEEESLFLVWILLFVFLIFLLVVFVYNYKKRNQS